MNRKLIIIDDPYRANSCPIDLPEIRRKMLETLKSRGVILTVTQVVHDKEIKWFEELI
jgi:hypothetical protein